MDVRVVKTNEGTIQKTNILNLQKAKEENSENATQLSQVIETVKLSNNAAAYPDYATTIGWEHPLLSINLEMAKKACDESWIICFKKPN